MAKPATAESQEKFPTISREEILARLQDRALALVNVMPRDTFKAGHIPGSMNLPVADIETQARRLITNLAQEIAIYCAGPS